MDITRRGGKGLGNPFVVPWGAGGPGEDYLSDVCAAHAEWLLLGDVPAREVVGVDGGRGPRIARADGTAFPAVIAPSRPQGSLTGAMAVAAVRAVLNAHFGKAHDQAHTVRFVGDQPGGAGADCHGDNLAAVARRLIAHRDATAASAPPVKVRATRKDKGQRRGPRRLKGGEEHRIGMLSLYRYRYGMERQVSTATRAAVAEAARLGVQPWLMDRQAAASEWHTEVPLQGGSESVGASSCCAGLTDCLAAGGAASETGTGGWELDEQELELGDVNDGEGLPEDNAAGSATAPGLVRAAIAGHRPARRQRGAARAEWTKRRARAFRRSLEQQRLELEVSEGERDHPAVDLSDGDYGAGDDVYEGDESYGGHGDASDADDGVQGGSAGGADSGAAGEATTRRPSTAVGDAGELQGVAGGSVAAAGNGADSSACDMDVSGSGAATEVMPMASGGGGGGDADDDEMGADDEAADEATPAGAEATPASAAAAQVGGSEASAGSSAHGMGVSNSGVAAEITPVASGGGGDGDADGDEAGADDVASGWRRQRRRGRRRGGRG